MTDKERWWYWRKWFALRIVLMIQGAIIPLHINYKTPRTKGMNIFQRYWENCIRNPTPYLRGKFTQPIPEVHPNPDKLVRGNTSGTATATRTMRSGPYIEEWTLSQRDNKKRPYWEKRKGWKFVDGEETFWPTFQLGPRK